MSSALSTNLIPKALIRDVHKVEHNGKNIPRASGCSFCQSSTKAIPNYASYCKGFASCKSHDLHNYIPSNTLSQRQHNSVCLVPHAVLATNPAAEETAKFSLDGKSEIQIGVGSGHFYRVDIQVSNSSPTLVLHWGVIRNGQGKWSLPSRQPNGTRNYKNRALRTPLKKSGNNSFLTIEIDDPTIESLEFLLVDEAQNRWFKNDGENFKVQLARDGKLTNRSTVPEELVQIQAYLMWERKGKQIYTPEQESEEYELARQELLMEVAKGVSVDDLQRKLTKKDSSSKVPVVPSNKIPDDLILIHAYIRWEKAGKPNYSKDKQLEEYEAARAELLEEVAKGVSVDDIRRKLTSDNTSKEFVVPKCEVPNDLIQTQAYVRWEKARKPNYSKDKQLEEYEAACAELLEEVAKGVPVDDIRRKLTRSDNTSKESVVPKCEVPNDLIQTQAYVRWENAGKPNYSKDKQLEEYEAARAELLEEVAKGVSVDDIRRKLTRSDNTSKESVVPKCEVPNDLIQTQAYVRWEKAGKPNYSKDKQLEEYEAARAVLLEEVAKGVSVDDIRRKLTRSDNTSKVSVVPKCEVPNDLIETQAYVRWEKAGKPNYSKDKQLEEYEAARAELLEEVAKGVSVDDIRRKLTRSDNTSKEPVLPKCEVPNDLIQTQAYVRWEKAGKPNYSKDKQLIEFEEARKELQKELDKGVSLDQIRNKITKGEDIDSRVSNQSQSKVRYNVERISRKKRDDLKLINKHNPEAVSLKDFERRTPTLLDLCSKSKEDQDGGHTLYKNISKIDNAKLLVLVTKPSKNIKIYVATDFSGPLALHWGLSKSPGEWMAPPATVLPSQSVILDGASEIQFMEGFNGESSLKFVEVEIKDGDFVGMPFVLRSGENWIKNNDSNFYIKFGTETTMDKKDVDGKGTARPLLDRIVNLESEAERSLMHRFNIAKDLVEHAKNEGELGLAGILVWMRFMATRQLTWNKNYNVKPREISRAQDDFTDLLQSIYQKYPGYREIVRTIMFTVGRGGQGDVGQRIRDEILLIQRHNDCKGGMMEEWHQKLHNNTSPDDVVICQALIEYIKGDFDISVYWKTLNSNGITKDRLLSYDRAIHSEPQFRSDQKEGLLRDLGNYMKTLKAVHSGADLESAIATCLGYSAEGQDFMAGVKIHPIEGLPHGFPELLEFVINHMEDKDVLSLLEGLIEARVELRPLLLGPHNRLKDLIFLDLALDSTVRTAVERSYEALDHDDPQKLMYFIALVVENLALSSDNNEDIVYCLKGWNYAIEMLRSKSDDWALYAKSVHDRTRLALATKAEHYQNIFQPSAGYLGSMLGIEPWALNIFTEELIRAGSAASLSMLLNRIDPVLRRAANLDSWQMISPVEVVGFVVVVDDLLSVQNKSYEEPTIIIAKRVKGEEEIPDGTVAVLTPDMPDVLSHVSVRARNGKVCFATCFDSAILSDLQSKEARILHLRPTSSDLIYREINDDDVSSSNIVTADEASGPSLTISKKAFGGKYAISADEFSVDMVGAKSRNIAFLKGKVPSWIGIPTSIALPFGVFEKVICNDANKDIADKVSILKKKLEEGDFDALHEIRNSILQLIASEQLVKELKLKMQESGMPWPGDCGEHWEKAWMAIKKVWASKWNERAYFSMKKVKLDHDALCMAVLVQEIISADYAFVIHTTNPSSGDPTEIYAEVVRGLGETLVGAYPGRALSFICKKTDLNSPKVLGFPSKPFGLFIRQSIIFRSDSNGEDLEGYAGAGLYDSVPMDEEEKVILDYSSDPLIIDANFRNSVLSSIARAGNAIEELYGSPQDIEGVVTDGKVFVVQTRPQM